MYVSTSSKISGHLDKVEDIIDLDSKTSFYSKSKNSYRRIFFKLLKLVDLLIGIFPQYSQYLDEYKFENISISTDNPNGSKFNCNSSTRSEWSTDTTTNSESSECGHSCFFQSMCKFYQSTLDSNHDLSSEDFILDSVPSTSNVEGISNIFSSEKESSFYTQSLRTCNTSIEVDVSPVKKKPSKTSKTCKKQANNHIDNSKSKYSLTSDLAIFLNNGKSDTDFERFVTKNIYRKNNKKLPLDIDKIIQNRVDNFKFEFTSDNSRDLYNVFSSIYSKEKTKDIKFAMTWLNTLYIEKAKSPTSQKYFNPSGVPGKLISFILADEYYRKHDNDDNRVWNELIQWCDRYDSKYRWSAPKCTSASSLKKLHLTDNIIVSAYRRWQNLCYSFNTQNILEDSMLRLYPSQFLKKVRSLKIMTDDELYALI